MDTFIDFLNEIKKPYIFTTIMIAFAASLGILYGVISRYISGFNSVLRKLARLLFFAPIWPVMVLWYAFVAIKYLVKVADFPQLVKDTKQQLTA